MLSPIYQSDVLSLANETPMAGHLGVKKRTQGYWTTSIGLE